MRKFFTEIFLIPAHFIVGIAFAWIPMLSWNYGLRIAFPELPVIGYWTAFWIALGLNYLRTLVVPIKED